jgi:hypothetical protein
MKLEVGKQYKLADGSTAVLLTVDGEAFKGVVYPALHPEATNEVMFDKWGNCFRCVETSYSKTTTTIFPWQIVREV